MNFKSISSYKYYFNFCDLNNGTFRIKRFIVYYIFDSICLKTFENQSYDTCPSSSASYCSVSSPLCCALACQTGDWRARVSHYSYQVLFYGLTPVAEIQPPVFYRQRCGHKMCTCAAAEVQTTKAMWSRLVCVFLWMLCLDLLYPGLHFIYLHEIILFECKIPHFATPNYDSTRAPFHS